MLRHLKHLIAALSIGLAVITPLALPVMVSAQSNVPSICEGVKATGSPCEPVETEPRDRLAAILKTIIDIFSMIVGFVAVLMIIVGGFKYVTSGGDSGNISSAKNTIIYALVGLAIVALSQFIVRFVLAKVA